MSATTFRQSGAGIRASLPWLSLDCGVLPCRFGSSCLITSLFLSFLLPVFFLLCFFVSPLSFLS